jgi:MOSC domain-containing protein YiiM
VSEASSAPGVVAAVHRSGARQFGKEPVEEITLVAGLGVEGDVHSGARVQHRSRVRADPSQPNLRQVHLLSEELLSALAEEGFSGIAPGALGENLTTRGIDLLALPTGTVLRLGDRALVALTGLRNPCAQLDAFRSGLLRALSPRDASGQIVRRAGVMGVVVIGGLVRAGDAIQISLPPGTALPLQRV